MKPLVALLLLALPAVTSAQTLLKPNVAAAGASAAPDRHAWYESRKAATPTPDDKFFMSSTLRECHNWLNDMSKIAPNWPASVDRIPWPDGPRKRIALAEHARCKGFAGRKDMRDEAMRLEREALAEGSIAASPIRVLALMRIDPARAADQAIDVAFASRDAYVYANMWPYLAGSESHARMREWPIYNPANLVTAWQLTVCGDRCGPDSPWQKNHCLHVGHCTEASIAEHVGGQPEKDRREIEKLAAFLNDVIAKGQWDRLGIPARRYPGIENVNRLPSRFN